MLLHHALEGVQVVDLAGYIAGAYCASLLADLGAEVVKVEPPGGDPFRGPAGAFQGWNRGKRSVVLNLTLPQGQEVLHRLVARADVVVENYRPGVARRLGADYETLRRVNPRIIYCSVSGYGQAGPFSHKPAFDPLLQAQSGAMAAQGGEGNPPMFLRVAISDYMAALLGAWGVVLALFHRARTGQGQRVETSLTNAVVAVQAGEFLLLEDPPPQQGDSLGVGPLYRMYQAQDGWLLVACTTEEEWRGLCRALEAEELAQDPRFSTPAGREAHAAALAEALAARFQKAGRETWLARLEREGVKGAPVHTPWEALEDPRLWEAGLVVAQEAPGLGPIRQMGLVVRFSATPGRVRGPAPALGQHTEEVLQELGYTSDAIQRLREQRVIT